MSKGVFFFNNKEVVMKIGYEKHYEKYPFTFFLKNPDVPGQEAWCCLSEKELLKFAAKLLKYAITVNKDNLDELFED